MEKEKVQKEISEEETIKLEEVINIFNDRVDKMQMDIKEVLGKNPNLRIDPEPEYFIVKNNIWDQWFRKLFAQFISVKLWMLALITVLLFTGAITNVQFASIFGVIAALKGGFQIATVYKEKRSDMSELDKT